MVPTRDDARDALRVKEKGKLQVFVHTPVRIPLLHFGSFRR